MKLKVAFFLGLMIVCITTIMEARQFDGPKYERECKKVFYKFSQELAKEYNLKLLNICSGFVVDSKATWCMLLTSDQKWTLEEGKHVAVEIAEKSVRELVVNPAFQKYFDGYNEYSEEYKRFNLGVKELRPTDMAFKLTFWDENVDRPLKPYLAEVIFKEGKLYYYYANPQTQALEKPFLMESLDLDFSNFRD